MEKITNQVVTLLPVAPSVWYGRSTTPPHRVRCNSSQVHHSPPHLKSRQSLRSRPVVLGQTSVSIMVRSYGCQRSLWCQYESPETSASCSGGGDMGDGNSR